MSVAKAAVLGVMIVGWLGPSALGGPMLFLGTFSNQQSPGAFTPKISAPTPAPSQAPAQGSTANLVSLGSTPIRLTMSDGPSAPQAFNPPTAPISTPAPLPVGSNPGIGMTQAPVVAAPPPPPAAPARSGVFDAVVNLAGGPYPNAGSLTSGNAQPWYLSRPVEALYGGQPTAQQRSDFDNAVLQRVGQTFRQSGIGVSLTDDPNAAAAHTMSVVSNTANPTAGQVIGMTYIGGNGFHFIDQSARSAQSVDQLEWIVAHNVAHELMLAFGVPEVHDTSGRFIDARNADLGMMIDPAARFSPEAARDLLSKDFQATGSTPVLMGAQILEPPAVPEPSTVALWLAGGAAFLLARSARSAPRSNRRP